MKKVIVIGLDGVEPKIVEPMLAAGELPTLATLRDQGGYTRIQTTYPAQTPVAWSTFATSTNPGGHGIFDFLSRDPKTYLPVLALSRYEQKNPFLPPKVINGRQGTAIWDVLTSRGIASTVIRCPCTYPPEPINGRMLAGVGVPDLRGGLGTSTFYSTQNGLASEHSEKIVHIDAGNGRIATHLIGPRNPKTRDDFHVPITIDVDTVARRATIRSDGQPSVLELREGEWSDWLKVKFKIGLFQSVRGMVRFYLARTEPALELYASPVNFDPEAPLFPISAPAEYAQELQARIGTFYTTGMAEDHDGLNNGRFDEEAYLAQCNDVLRERERMMRYELARFREGLFFCLFDTPDRLQHMFWRFREKHHPANAGEFSPDLARVIEEHYRACDEIIGTVLEATDDETLVIVLSDHGMNSFQRGLNLNTWLYENGLLALRNGTVPGDDAGDFFRSVDWSRTRAYALGLGGIFLNLKGREEQGIVPVDDARNLKSSIADALTGLTDPQRGERAVRSVMSRETIYSGPYVDSAPDVLVNFAPGYRVSWDTPLGGVPATLFDDNVKKWAGDHVIDPALAPGILFMNRPFAEEAVHLRDMAPTILTALGVPKGPMMEGDSIL